MATTFDDLDTGGYEKRNTKPIWTMDLDDEGNDKNILNWVKNEIDYLLHENSDRLRRNERNMALYRGIAYATQEGAPNVRDRSDSRFRDIKKIVVNHVYDLTQNIVSRYIKYKPAVAVMPANDEFEDKVSAKATDALLKHIWYTQNFENHITARTALDTAIIGESYLWIEWDPDKGDLHPDWKKESKDGKMPKIALLDETGKPVKDDLGNTIYIEKPIKVGDVSYDVVHADDVFLEREESFDKCKYVFRKHLMHVEEARARWPKSAGNIKASRNTDINDYASLVNIESSKSEVVVWEFWHKGTRELPSGRCIWFTYDTILENEAHLYSHLDFPFERLTDIEWPLEPHGVSFYENIKGLTGVYNNLTNMIVRNQFLAAHPKWVVPAGSTKIEALGNDITIVQYKGAQPPMLVQSAPTPQEVFVFRDKLKEEFQQISGVFGVSRGEPPPGIKAGVALQFLNEQENERFNMHVLKWNDWIKRTAIKTISVCGDYYDSTDDRMIRVIGKNNAWMTSFFDASHLSKDYDVKVQNSSALPQSKAARMQTVMDLAGQFPDMFPPEQVLDMLDLAQSDKFVDAATMSVRSAEAENEQLLNGEKVNEPEEYENLVIHWKIHMTKIQEWAFKNQTPKKVQEAFIDHVRATEYLMVEKAKSNPTFAKQIEVLPQFPVFFVSAPAIVEAPPSAVQPSPSNPQPGGGFPPEAPLPTDLGPPSLEAQALEGGIPEGEPPPIEPSGAI